MTEYRSNHAFAGRTGRHRADTRKDRIVGWFRQLLLTETRDR